MYAFLAMCLTLILSPNSVVESTLPSNTKSLYYKDLETTDIIDGRILEISENINFQEMNSAVSKDYLSNSRKSIVLT